MTSNAKNVSIWWRHHEILALRESDTYLNIGPGHVRVSPCNNSLPEPMVTGVRVTIPGPKWVNGLPVIAYYPPMDQWMEVSRQACIYEYIHIYIHIYIHTHILVSVVHTYTHTYRYGRCGHHEPEYHIGSPAQQGRRFRALAENPGPFTSGLQHNTNIISYGQSGKFEILLKRHSAVGAWLVITCPVKCHINYCPFPNINGCTVEVWEWENDFIPHFNYNWCDHLSMLWLMLINVSGEGPSAFLWHCSSHQSLHRLLIQSSLTCVLWTWWRHQMETFSA